MEVSVCIPGACKMKSKQTRVQKISTGESDVKRGGSRTKSAHPSSKFNVPAEVAAVFTEAARVATGRMNLEQKLLRERENMNDGVMTDHGERPAKAVANRLAVETAM